MVVTTRRRFALQSYGAVIQNSAYGTAEKCSHPKGLGHFSYLKACPFGKKDDIVT
jgi:hypothetical protein